MSTCMSDLKTLSLTNTLEDIKNMSKEEFKTILKQRIQKVAFQHLKDKQGSKGSEIQYSDLEMPDYLRPNNKGLSIDDQRYIFEMRNRMVNLPANFGSMSQCVCSENEDMSHIYYCRYLNYKEEETQQKYEEIFSNNLNNQLKVLRRFQTNMNERNKQRNNSEKSHHVIPSVDPLFSVRV